MYMYVEIKLTERGKIRFVVIADGITPVTDPSLEDDTRHSHAVTAGGGHSRFTLETAQPGGSSLLLYMYHGPESKGPLVGGCFCVLI